ncbi:hypothetical protein HF282_03795 [Acidithiobacillus ferrooxidans]|nr:hypothetical protein [Acidithiobacillus ferrooxidans]
MGPKDSWKKPDWKRDLFGAAVLYAIMSLKVSQLEMLVAMVMATIVILLREYL